jgi:hypothetical protein
MSLTLDSSIDDHVGTIVVSGSVPAIAAGYIFAIDDELLRFTGFGEELAPRGVYPRPKDPQRWRVQRAIGDSIAAAHDGGAELLAVRDAWARSADLTPPGPFAPSLGSSVVVDVTIPSGSDNLGSALIAAIAALADPLEVTWATIVAVCMADPGESWRLAGYELVWPADIGGTIVWAPLVVVTANGETIGEGFTAAATRQAVATDADVAGAVLTLLMGVGEP